MRLQGADETVGRADGELVGLPRVQCGDTVHDGIYLAEMMCAELNRTGKVYKGLWEEGCFALQAVDLPYR
jgi:hypothetical protein